MSKTRAVIPVGEVLSRVLQELGRHQRLSQDQMEMLWGRLVGEQAAQNSWPRSLTKGRLLIEVKNSGWLYTLRGMKDELLCAWIELLGAQQVRNLSFRMGEREEGWPKGA